MAKKQYTLSVALNPEQYDWFCQEMLGLEPGQNPGRGQVAEFFKTGGSLLGMPEDKPFKAMKAERTEKRDYFLEYQRKRRAKLKQSNT